MQAIEVPAYDVLLTSISPGSPEVDRVILAFPASHVLPLPTEAGAVWEGGRIEVKKGTLTVHCPRLPWLHFPLAVMDDDVHPLSARELGRLLERVQGVWLAAMEGGIVVAAGYFTTTPDAQPEEE